MSDRWTRLLSVVFHPLVMPVLGILILFYSGTYLSFLPLEIKHMILLVVVTGMFLLPVSLVPFYLYRKLISNIEFSNRHERFIPLLVTTVLYYLTYFILKRIPVSGLILGMVLSSAVALFMLMLINFWYPISLHAAGIAGLFGFLLAITLRYGLLTPVFLYISAVLAGVIGTVRLKQGAHKPSDIYIGYLSGFTICFLCNFLYRFG